MEPESILDQTRVPLDINGLENEIKVVKAAIEVGAAGAGLRDGNRLPFTVESQEQTQWCWAAIAASVSKYYDSTGNWKQCELANHELGQQTCCDDGATPQCNRPWRLDYALHTAGNLENWSEGATSVVGIRAEVDAERPLGIRIGWQGGGGHFIVVAGYGAGADPLLAIEDPWLGQRDVNYSTLLTTYDGTGSWTHSYFTHG